MKKLLADYLKLANEEQIDWYDFKGSYYYVYYEIEGGMWDTEIQLEDLLVFIYNKK